MGMSFEEIFPSDTEAFCELYEIYRALFPFPDECEPPEAFAEIAALNENPDAHARFGQWREVVAAIRLTEGGPIVGGHVFGVTTSPAHIAFGCRASVQGIYIFLVKSARGRLDFIRKAKHYAVSRALSTFGFEPKSDKIPPLIFLEVNNPLRMSGGQIARDAESSGINPFQRYDVYKRLNLRPLDLPYIQPALRADAKPVEYLDLFCTADIAPEIPADLIAAHLRGFISLSVLKGRDASADPDFAHMEKLLRSVKTVPFIDDGRPDQQEIRDRAK
jgi:hypothetical protein